MRVWFQIHFLTLVLTLLARTEAYGATPDSVPFEKKPPTEAPQTEQPRGDGHEIQDYNLMPSPPKGPLPREATETFYYPYRQAITPRFGLAFTSDSEHKYEYFLGIAYLWPRFYQPQAELGADLFSGFGGHLNFGVRHTFLDRNYYRPYFLWGFSHEVVAKDHLATITNIKNYYLRGAVGFEDTLKLPKSVRLDLEMRLGLERWMLMLSLGYSWGF